MTIYVISKFIICVFVIPYFLLNFLINHIYGMSIIEVLVYFFKHYSEVDGHAALVILSVIFLPMMLFPLAGLLNYTWVATVGVEKTYVYVGSDDISGFYVDPKDENTKVVDGPYIGETRSFDDAYWMLDVYHDPNEPNYVGELKSKGKGLSLGALVSFSISGFFIVFTALTYYARVVYEHKFSDVIKATDPTPFELFLTSLNIGEGVYFIILIGSLFVSVILTLMTSTTSDRRHDDFPSSISPGNGVQVRPYKVEVVKTSRQKQISDRLGNRSVESVETSVRNIYVKVEKGVDLPVFLMFSLDLKEHSEQYSQVVTKIKNNEDIVMKIDEDMTLYLDHSTFSRNLLLDR